MLIEDVLGLEIVGSENTIRWRISRHDSHGIEGIQLADQLVTLLCRPDDDSVRIEVTCESPFRLEIIKDGIETAHQVDAGKTAFTIR